MATMLATIMNRARNNRGISALEYEHFVLTTVEAALEMTLNAIDNGTDWAGDNSVRDIVDPAQIIAQLKEDFTESVQQYWPEPVQIGSARTEPYNPLDEDEAPYTPLFAKRETTCGIGPVDALDEDNEDIQSLMDRDRE